jgi:hypothetical protein
VAEADVKVQVCLFGFDLLYLNGESLVTRPFQVCPFMHCTGSAQFATWSWKLIRNADPALGDKTLFPDEGRSSRPIMMD